MCLASTVVASSSFMQEAAGSSRFTVMTNIFVTEFSETFRKYSIVLFYSKCYMSALREVSPRRTRISALNLITRFPPIHL